MGANTHKINAKSVLAYSFMPGIIPRARALATGGFSYLAFLFACLYRTVRILPPNHPYVNPANIGKFGLYKVIIAAANNVRFDRKNLDQIGIFFVLLTGVVLIFLQFLLFIMAILSGRAFAQVPGFESIFITENPQNDIAFMMLDYVFGIPAIGGGGTFFESNALDGGGPTPFHLGLHALFNFYNLAILLVGVLIFLYYVVVVVIETAKTGVPFGRRFSKLYAPLRLVVAVGLLVPLFSGFNAAQYITLTAAKLGSSFATNGWLTFNAELQAEGMTPLGMPRETVVARPRIPGLDGLLHFSAVYHACRTAYDLWAPVNARNPQQGGVCIRPYIVVNGAAQAFAGSYSESCEDGAPAGGYIDYATAKEEFGTNDVEIILGEYDPAAHSSFAGSVKPYCGKMTISLSHDNPGIWNGEGGIRAVEEVYFNTTRDVLHPAADGDTSVFRLIGERAAHSFIETASDAYNPCIHSGELGDGGRCQASWAPPSTVFVGPINVVRENMVRAITDAYNQFREGLDLRLTEELANRGWGGAGIWYNHIADINGAFTGAVYATPSVKNYPMVMEMVRNERMKQNRNGGICKTFEPNLGSGKDVKFQTNKDRVIANASNGTFMYFACDKPTQQIGQAAPAPAGPPAAGDGVCDLGTDIQLTTGSAGKGGTSNIIIDVMNLVFGLNGLFDIRTATCYDPATGRPLIHPLAQLSTIGKSLVENSIRSMGMALGASFGAGILGALNSHLGQAAQAASSMLVAIASIGLVAGFILYYVLPFMPFIYFFFAVGAWVKSIFEAMVGVPLWGLAHLHIDGDGLPGRSAMSGYFLIFEIFLRPIVILFGLIGGVAVFTAMAVILNNLFDLVVMNSTGATPDGSTAAVGAGQVQEFRRGVIDKFFFTIMYTVLIYMIATASFKMIDTIPANIMRWISSPVGKFNDNTGDPVGGLTKYAAVGGAQITGQVFEGLNQGAQGLGGLGGSLIKAMKSKDGGGGGGGGQQAGT